MATVTERHVGGRPRKWQPCRFGVFLEAAMSRRSMTLDQLAKRSGVAPRTLYQLIAGQTPDPRNSTIAALADALHVPAGRIVRIALESSRELEKESRRTA